jgi:hypothetical protein
VSMCSLVVGYVVFNLKVPTGSFPQVRELRYHSVACFCKSHFVLDGKKFIFLIAKLCDTDVRMRGDDPDLKGGNILCLS